LEGLYRLVNFVIQLNGQNAIEKSMKESNRADIDLLLWCLPYFMAVLTNRPREAEKPMSWRMRMGSGELANIMPKKLSFGGNLKKK
jgi:hypothetical protein